MRRRHALAWLGGGLALVTAVVALRETQQADGPLPAAPGPTTATATEVTWFAADGVELPEPGAAPAPPAAVEVSQTGPERLRVAWGAALPGGTAPDNAVGYEVRWTSLATGAGGTRLVSAPEVELDGLRPGQDTAVEVRSVDAFGRRSPPTAASVTATPAESRVPDPRLYPGLAEPFDGPFSVDRAVVAGRWHLTGYPGCTTAAADRGVLTVDLECGPDVAMLRARSPMELGPAGGRVLVVTDAAGPSGRLTVDLVPGRADRVGDGRTPEPAVPRNGTAVSDPALPDGTLRVLVDDGGARVITGPGVQRVAAPAAPPPAPARGVGVLHAFEILIDGTGVRVLQDGVPVAAAGVVVPWTSAHLLIGIHDPPGLQSRVRLDAVGFSGPAYQPPMSYAQTVVPATQRVLGPAEQAPSIGISRRPLASAAAARFVATVSSEPGVDLDQLVVQHGDVTIPARPVVDGRPAVPGAEVTVAADLPAALLGPGGPGSVSPLVLRAPGADAARVPIVGSYLEITPLPGAELPPPGTRTPSDPRPVAPPRASVRLLDGASGERATVAPGASVVVEVTIDGLGGQLDGATLAGLAGFQLWVDRRQVAGVPTAADGPGIGGVYRVTVPTGSLTAGRHVVELRLFPADAAVRADSVLASWQLS